MNDLNKESTHVGQLSDSLNGYLNIYKTHMMTSLRAIDYFNEVYAGKNCNEEGCKLDD